MILSPQRRRGRRGFAERALRVLCVLGASAVLFSPVRGDELSDQLIAPALAIAAVSTAPALEVDGEHVHVENAEVVARPFALDAALDDLVAAFRAESGAADLAAFAAAHATGEPAPL